MKTIDAAAMEFEMQNFKSGKIEIERLAFKAGVQFAEEWISVDDELPSKDIGIVLLMFDYYPENVTTGDVDRNDGLIYPHYRFVDWKKITHWRPINRKS